MNLATGWWVVTKWFDAGLRCALAWALVGGLSAVWPTFACAQSSAGERPRSVEPTLALTEDINAPTASPAEQLDQPFEAIDFSDPGAVGAWIETRLTRGESVMASEEATRLMDWVDDTAPQLRLQMARDIYFGAGRLAFGVAADDRVLEFLIKARQLAEGQAMVADIQRWVGDVYAATGAFEQALEVYLDGLQVEGLTPVTQGELFLSLGDVSRRLGETERALRYFSRAEEVADTAGLADLLVRVRLFQAAAYRQVDENARALALYEDGLQQARALNDVVVEAMFYNNLGNVLRDMGEYPRALAYFDQALEISKSQGLDYGVGINHINQAVTHYLEQDFNQALAKYEQAEAILDGMDRPYEQRMVYEGFAYVYQALGQYEAAFDALMRFNALNNQVLDKETQIASEEIQTRYETLLKDSELALQASELQRQRQRLYQAVLVIAALVVLVGGLMAFVRYRNQAFRALYLRNKELMLATARAKQARQMSGQPATDWPIVDLMAKEDVADAQAEGDERLRGLYERLIALFDEEKIFTRADLSIDEVATRLGSNRTYVAQAISLVTDMSFRHFVNFYRVNEARRLLHENRRSWSARGLAEEVGYGSVSSLYRAFDQHVGMSPARYVEAIQADSLRPN